MRMSEPPPVVDHFMGGVRSAVALLGLHEQDLVLGGLQYLDGFRHRRRVDPIFRVHEKPAAGFDGGANLVHLLHDALVHERFRYVLADRGLVVAASEISGERLLANDVFPACMASTIIAACNAGAVQISTTSISLSASRLLKSRCVLRI